MTWCYLHDAKYSENPPLTYGVLPSPGGTAVAAATAPTFDVVVAEGQHLSMRFLKMQFLCSKITTDGGNSRNLGSTSFKNKNQEERLKFIYLICSFRNNFVS